MSDGESKTYLESLGLKGGSDYSFGESLSYPLQTGPEFTQDYGYATRGVRDTGSAEARSASAD